MIISNLDKDTQNKLFKHLDLVLEKNKTLNLTRIDTREKGILLHIEDSLSCLEEFAEQDGKFLDIGTGGGFPGIPLGIVSGRPGVLIDSVKKKANAVQEIIENLNLQDHLASHGIRSEEYALENPEAFDTVVARAVSSLPVLEELAAPLLVNNGKLITLRGVETAETLDEAKGAGEKLGFELESVRKLKLDNQYDRTICVFKKAGEPSIKLPRRPGMAQKRPIT